MWTRLRHLLEMIRFSHTVFALPFALLAAVMAWSVPDGRRASRCRFARATCWGFCSAWCVRAARRWPSIGWRSGARSAEPAHAAVAICRPDLDGAERRGVCRRCLASGFVAATCCFCRTGCRCISPCPVLGFLFAYSYTKRFTWAAHFWLGAALMLAPIATWIALRGEAS